MANIDHTFTAEISRCFRDCFIYGNMDTSIPSTIWVRL